MKTENREVTLGMNEESINLRLPPATVGYTGSGSLHRTGRLLLRLAYYEVGLPLGVNTVFAQYRMNHTIARANAR
jgi:hypothetical protein